MKTDTASGQFKKHSFLHEILWCLGALVLCICCGVVLMYGSYKLPLAPIQQHARESLPNFSEDHPSYDYWAPWYHVARLDMTTDATMIREAVYDTGMGTLKSSMLNMMPIYIQKDSTQKQASDSSVEPEFPSATDLREYLASEEDQNPDLDEYSTMYGRYWHGYLIFLKPLLMKFSLSQIRIINVSVILLLLGWAIFEISRKGNWIALSGFLLAVAVINPVSASLSMQYVNSMVLMLIGTAIMFRKELWKTDDSWKLFLFMGIGSAFFDFLTYPLVTLGIPLALGVFMNYTQSLKTMIGKSLNSCICWAVGYGGMWAGKWVAGSLLTGTNLIANGLNRAAMRTNGGEAVEEHVSLLETFQLNWDTAFIDVMKWIIIFVLIATLCWLLWKKVKPARNSMFWLLAVISLFPFAWYIVLNNHSWHHFWMTYRILAVFVCSGYLAIFSFFQKGILARKKTELQTMLQQADSDLDWLEGKTSVKPDELAGDLTPETNLKNSSKTI